MTLDLSRAIWDTRTPDRLFGDHPRVSAPWPRAAKPKHGRLYPGDELARGLSGPQHVQPVDPRTLSATQPWVTAAGIDYYLCDEYERTGRTYADHQSAVNRLPVIWEASGGRRLILTGHHRSAAALIQGRPVLARVLPAACSSSYRSVTALLHVESAPGAEVHRDPAHAAAAVGAGRPASVPDGRRAVRVLALLGLPLLEARRAARFSRTGSLR